jgi:hypothetical protein
VYVLYEYDVHALDEECKTDHGAAMEYSVCTRSVLYECNVHALDEEGKTDHGAAMEYSRYLRYASVNRPLLPYK